MTLFEKARKYLYPEGKFDPEALITLLEHEALIIARDAYFVDGPYYGFWGECGTGAHVRATVLAGLWARNPLLTAYNPDKGPDMWREVHNLEEEIARRFVLADFFYVHKTRGFVGTIEALVHAFGRNSFYVIKDIEVGAEIRGQAVTDDQVLLINVMREIVRRVVALCGRPIYPSEEIAGMNMPISSAELEGDVVQRVSDSVRAKNRKLIVELDELLSEKFGIVHRYEGWLKSSNIALSFNPFIFQLDMLMALLVINSRKKNAGQLNIVVPDFSLWGQPGYTEFEVVQGSGRFETIDGGLLKDLLRTPAPYLKRLALIAPTSVIFTGKPLAIR